MVVVVVTVVGTERAAIKSSSISSSSSSNSFSMWYSQKTGFELGSRFTGKNAVRCTGAETDAFQLKIH